MTSLHLVIQPSENINFIVKYVVGKKIELLHINHKLPIQKHTGIKKNNIVQCETEKKSFKIHRKAFCTNNI